MFYHAGQSRVLDSPDKLVGAEGAFASRAPDIDPLGVEDKNVTVDPAQRRSERVKTQRIIGGDKNRRRGIGRPGSTRWPWRLISHLARA